MNNLFHDKHFTSTAARLVMYCATLVVVGIVFWKAPEQAVEIMKTGAMMLGGAAVGSKLGIKV
jgi:hypothetical protein